LILGPFLPLPQGPRSFVCLWKLSKAPQWPGPVLVLVMLWGLVNVVLPSDNLSWLFFDGSSRTRGSVT
jgi:hypothetical protein